MATFSSKNTQLSVTGGAAHVKINNATGSGTALYVQPEHLTTGNSTANIVAAAPVTLSIGAYGFPYETVIFTRTGSTGNVGLTWGVSTNGVFMFQLTWSSGSDAVNITAETADGDAFGNIPHNIAGTVAVTAITANSTGTLYIG